MNDKNESSRAQFLLYGISRFEVDAYLSELTKWSIIEAQKLGEPLKYGVVLVLCKISILESRYLV